MINIHYPNFIEYKVKILEGLGKMVFIFLLIASISTPVLSQNSVRRQTIAILEFEGNGVPDQTMQDVTKRFVTEYAGFKGSKFIIMDRDQMQRSLQEQGVRIYGCSTFKCAMDAGVVLGTDFVVGILTKNGSVYSLRSQLIDVKNSKTVNRAEYDHITGDIVTVMSKEVKKAAAYLASAKLESEVIQKEVAEIPDQK